MEGAPSGRPFSLTLSVAVLLNQPRAEGVSYDRLPHFIAAWIWNPAPLAQALVARADRRVGGTDAILLVDDTALPKKGEGSVGVAPPYATTLGKNANCETMVSLTLALRSTSVAHIDLHEAA